MFLIPCLIVNQKLSTPLKPSAIETRGIETLDTDPENESPDTDPERPDTVLATGIPDMG